MCATERSIAPLRFGDWAHHNIREHTLRSHISVWVAGAAFLLALCGLTHHGPALADESGWSLQITPRLGANERVCFGRSCRNEEDQYAAKLLRVCLNRDAKTAGFFSAGEWVVAVGPDGPATCRERFYADTGRKILFLQANFLSDPRLNVGRPVTIRCEPNGASGDDYDVCASEFFRPNSSNERFKVLDQSAVLRVVRDAKVIASIQQYMLEDFKRRAELQRTQYLADFQQAKESLVALRAFEQNYRANDPDKLIDQLVEVKNELLLQEYRDRFSRIRTPEDMKAFITEYRENDPENKVQLVRGLLEAQVQRQQDEARAAAKLKAAEELPLKLVEYERQIIWCKRRTEAAREVIAREEEIGRISGFVNKKIMREAGESIVSCASNNPKLFAEYKQLGGRRTYQELK